MTAAPGSAAPPPAVAPELPPKPEEPLAGECCGRGCINCVWIYYEQALGRWRRQCEEIGARRAAADARPVDPPVP